MEGAVLDESIPYHEDFKLYPSQPELEQNIKDTLKRHFPSITYSLTNPIKLTFSRDFHHFSVHYIGESIEVIFSISVSDQTQITCVYIPSYLLIAYMSSDAKQLAAAATRTIIKEIPFITHVVIRLELTSEPTQPTINQ